jgi:hypothetical protein
VTYCVSEIRTFIKINMTRRGFGGGSGQKKFSRKEPPLIKRNSYLCYLDVVSYNNVSNIQSQVIPYYGSYSYGVVLRD